MNDVPPESPECPLDKQDCHWLTELLDLRGQVSQLEQLITTDSLTGLFNYRYFMQTMESEMQRSRRSGEALSLILADIDHFKRVNDRQGHEAGNSALKLVARLFRQVTRPFDIVCRYGGEEFVVILPQTDLPMAAAVAERLRSALQAETVVRHDQQFSITASMGISTYLSNRQVTLGQLVEEADGYLYQAKHLGRNRVCHEEFEPLPVQTEVSPDEKSALFATFGNED